MFKKVMKKIKGLNYTLKLKISKIWSGVYFNFDELPQNSRSHKSSVFLKETYELTVDLINMSKKKLSLISTEEDLLFANLVASYFSFSQKEVKILDFGGAMGRSYILLKNSIASDIDINYFIVETQEMCEKGKSIYENDNKIKFLSELPKNDEKIDIILFNSSLQYINDFESLFDNLIKYNPEFFVLLRLSAGEIKSFISVQKNVSKTLLPHRFYNINDFANFLKEKHYKLLFSSLHKRKFNMNNFDPDYRLDYHSNLLFGKID